MLGIYIAAAFLCSWRLTDLVMGDQIFAWARNFRPEPKFNPARCIFCVTVWAGLVATAGFYFVPWINFPLAFSQLVLICQQGLNWQAFQKWLMMNKTRHVVLQPLSNGQVNAEAFHMPMAEAQRMIRELAQQLPAKPNGLH